MVQGGLTRALGVCLCTAALLLAAATSASASVYLGALISGETYGQAGHAPKNLAAWELFERHAGKRVAILNQGQPWGQWDKVEADATAARGAIPLVTMGLPEGVTLESVANGGQDATIKKWAQEAKAFGRPFLFAPWWEMNGGWYTWGKSPFFIAAWRRFHDLVVGQGATNVTWTWLVNSIWSDPASSPAPYYPGDAYVDWTGLDSYNWGENPAQPDRWITPNQTINPTLKILREVAPKKPVIIVENAASEYGGNKADWIREMLTTYLPHHPEIKAYLWFNWNFLKRGVRHDWPIESSTPAQQQFRQAVQSSFFVPGPISLPLLKKVPLPPTGTTEATQPTDIFVPAEVPTAPDVAVAADGTATVVWSARTNGRFTVYMRHIGPDGTGPATPLSEPSQDALAPQVAVAPDGTATVVWIRSDGSSFVVQARRVGPDGTLAAATETLSETGRDAADPQVDVGGDGTATVVWKRFDGSRYLVEERRLTAAGALLPAAASNVLSEPGQDAVEPAVAAAPDGGAAVVWSRYDGTHSIVQARRIDPSGSPAATTAGLSAAGQSAVQPQVAVAPGGAATVVWTRFDGSHWVIQKQRLAVAGAPEGVVANLSNPTGNAAEPQLAVGGDGKVTVVWDRYDGSSFVVQARRIDAAGAVAANTLNLSATGRDAGEPQVDVSPNGTATVLWSRFDGSNFIVQRRDVAANETLSAVSGLSAPGRRGSAPAVAWGSGGDLMTSWRRFAGSGDAVEAAPLPAPFPPLPPLTPPPPSEEEPEEGPGGEPEQEPAPEKPSGPPAPPGGLAAGNAIAGSSLPAPPPAATGAATMRFVKVIVNRRRGTARLQLEVSGPGRLVMKGAAPRDRVVDSGGTVMLRIVPKRAQRQLLTRNGHLSLKVTVGYEPLAGEPLSRSLTVRLKQLR
jgi:Glycosyl hydrolase family 26